ncbi:hypothetical protein [Streptomyces sp. AK02-01A]|uniref:hypothetical protein n=1 Tax=Streptomyces sp. AK02-01A TaxID=3028648 RepID=UPI0029B0ACDD|nr:hypothetical protein [Streptomyces sp. AK02-01A]MDX3850838.1 hypothetical protein [Streptomyces sp. AK02-01A]
MASAYPCACGAPVAPPLVTGAAVQPITRRTWAEEWVPVRCTACGREDHWPQPELGCPCGSVLRIAVRTPRAGATPPLTPGAEAPDPAGRPSQEPPARPPFSPLTIRTAHDAVTAAALYLRWLGFQSVVQAEEPSPSGIDLRGPDLIAQVDPTTSATSLRSVECLWLNGLNASAVSVFFSLAGYADDALARADEVGLPLFALDLTGTPQPVNGPAEELVASGAAR